MKASIKTKLFVGMSCLITFFVVSSWFLNSQYLSKYYAWQKKAALVDIKDRIDELYQGDPDAVAIVLENFERNRGINIYLLSSNYELKYSSFSRPFRPEHRRGGIERIPLFPGVQPKLNSLNQGENLIGVIPDPRLQTDFLLLASRLDNGDILVLSTPLTAITESAKVANRFYLFTGLVTIILGGIAVFFYTNRFTKPILELNDIAQQMSKLDFTRKYKAKSDDEIGQLGNSINSLSDQLDQAIEELREANSKLMEDIERERQIDQMRKAFISNVSHELKTPVALIQGYAEGLKLNVNEDEESKDFYCDVIMDEADKMHRLVKDLLNLSQIESGYFRLEKTDFDISGLINQVVAKFGPIVTEKEIEVSVISTPDSMVNADFGRIEQVLVNYLTNAINHVDHHKVIRIEVASSKDKVRVQVYNSGKTIPDEDIDKIWTSFYKVDKARTRAYGGTGLGLSVVRAIMDLHGKAFGVANYEQGVVFWFEVDRVA